MDFGVGLDSHPKELFKMHNITILHRVCATESIIDNYGNSEKH